MSSDDAFLEELAKQLPLKRLYKDALSPAAKQTGELLEDLVKVLRLALAPVQLGAALQDRFRRFLEVALNRVPIENRIAPAPQILGPVLEGVRYEPEGTPVDEMFLQLLSSSMDVERVADAHPSFPLIVRQLSADEAKVLNGISTAPTPLRLVQTFRIANNLTYPDATELDELPTDGLLFPANIPMYREHLEKLALLAYNVEKQMEPIRDAGGRQTGGRNFLAYRLTAFGESFMRACAKPSHQRDPASGE